MMSMSTNPRNFTAEPSSITLKPYESREVNIVYSPSKIGVTQTADVTFRHDSLGEWIYNLLGVGLPPGRQEATEVESSLHNRLSAMVNFMNPFDRPLECKIRLDRLEEHRSIF